MKKYVIVDQIRNGDEFEDAFDTKAEAIEQADREWAHLSEHDKKRREFYAVMCGEYDEDGCLDFNTAEIVKEYK